MINVSAILCVLNESKNISIILDNINYLQGHEIIIVDGGSSDGTYEALLEIEGITVVQLKNKGLLAQRLLGIKKAAHKLIFLFDADDNLENINICELAEELGEKKLDGINLRLKAPDRNRYWEGCWSSYFTACIPKKQNAQILGRPCLTYKKLFSNIKSQDGIFNDDTYLRFEQKKYFGKLLYNYSIQAITREVPNTFGQNFKQFRHYGLSDRKISHSKVGIKLDLVYHTLIRIAILRTIQTIMSGKPQHAPFTIMLGVVRCFYLLKGSAR
jgi:glycosyltransferase involved in cell wall biosynthesis